MEQMMEHFRDHPDVSQISSAGSLRRAKETIGDLDVLVATKNPKRNTEHFVSFPLIYRVLAKCDTKAYVFLKNGMQSDLRGGPNHDCPVGLCDLTGTNKH